jgi:hypothetical protein
MINLLFGTLKRKKLLNFSTEKLQFPSSTPQARHFTSHINVYECYDNTRETKSINKNNRKKAKALAWLFFSFKTGKQPEAGT